MTPADVYSTEGVARGQHARSQTWLISNGFRSKTRGLALRGRRENTRV